MQQSSAFAPEHGTQGIKPSAADADAPKQLRAFRTYLSKLFLYLGSAWVGAADGGSLRVGLGRVMRCLLADGPDQMSSDALIIQQCAYLLFSTAGLKADVPPGGPRCLGRIPV